MKKNILTPLFFIVTLSLCIITNTVQAQSINKITISVKEIKYDDPNFTALRESLKKNPKVKSVKPSYADGVAILSFTYTGEAPQLWEEIPKTSKRFFDLAGISNDAISLNYVNPQKNGANSTAETSAAQTKNINKKDCFDCDYFPMCKYDDTKKYDGGHIYRGVRESDVSIAYYNCENGVVTEKWVTSSNEQYKAVDYNPFTDRETVIYYEGKPVYTTHTQIILKTNAAIDEEWKSEDDIYRKIITKNASVLIDEVKYDNVIVVCKRSNVFNYALGWVDAYSYIYYIKGIGDAFVESSMQPEPKTKLSILQEFKAGLNAGRIDTSLVGSWSVFAEPDPDGRFKSFYKINADGSYTYTNEFRKIEDRIEKGSWRVINDTLKFFHKGGINKQKIDKINNQQTGKPSIVMHDVALKLAFPNNSPNYDPKTEYHNIDNKGPWKEVP